MIIEQEDLLTDSNQELDYYSLLDRCDIPRSKGTNRPQTLKQLSNYFIIEEIKVSKGKTKYKIIGKIDNPLPIKKGRPKGIEYEKEKEYLLYSLMSDCIDKRRDLENINRVQRGGTAIAVHFGILNKIKINQFQEESYEYKFLKENYSLLNILYKLIYGKKKNIFNFIDNNSSISMSKSLMLMKDNYKDDNQPLFIRIDDHYEKMKDVLEFNYDDFIHGYCVNRKVERIFEMQDEGYTDDKINNFRNKIFTDYNIYNYKHENEPFQKKIEEYFLSEYEQFKPAHYNFVCVRNLIINDNSKYSHLLNNKVDIDNKLTYEYRKILNNDTINDLSNIFLKRNDNKKDDIYKKFLEILEICIRIS